MFNPETSFQTDMEYHINFIHAKSQFDSTLRMELVRIGSVRDKLFSLKLYPLLEILPGLYSDMGRPAKNQSQIIRSLVLFTFLFGKTEAVFSLTAWVNNVLPFNPVYIALIGCRDRDSLPPLGSYYDLMKRFWHGSKDRYRRTTLFSASKNGKKPNKKIGPDGKLVEPEPDTNSTVSLKNQIIQGLQLSDNPEGPLEDFFYLCAVLPSIKTGLINNENLTVSGDGTAVPVHANHRGRRQKGCNRPDCPNISFCPRHYSDPDAEWGWDSHEKEWYFGRTLYMLCTRNTHFKVEVPVLMKFLSAKRHDSICFFHAVDELGRHMPAVSPANICLDSAHDNIATYELLERWDINALIDINGRNSSCTGFPEDISLNKNGLPLCMAGFKMHSWGYDKNKEAVKYRCPLACGDVEECACKDQCSSSKYGRTFYLNPHGDLRYFPRIPRDSDTFKSIYAQRTACERINNRVLNDYHLQHLKIRGDIHFSFWTTIIGICIHLDARAKAHLL
jgi:hypothetical protein